MRQYSRGNLRRVTPSNLSLSVPFNLKQCGSGLKIGSTTDYTFRYGEALDSSCAAVRAGVYLHHGVHPQESGYAHPKHQPNHVEYRGDQLRLAADFVFVLLRGGSVTTI